jgi:hypothetical protein
LATDPTDWLLEENTPSVGYFALTTLCKKPETVPEVIEVKKEIMNIGTLPMILEKQNKQGYWETPDKFFIWK